MCGPIQVSATLFQGVSKVLDTPGILEAEGREAAWGRERSEQHGPEVYSSRSDYLPEAPTCIRQKCTYIGVYSFLGDRLR